MIDDDAKRAERWAKTERLATGITDHGVGRALKIYFLVYLPIGIVLVLGVSLLVFALIDGNAQEEWETYLTYALMLAGVAALVGGFIYGVKRVNPLVRPQRAAALVWLDKAEKKRITKQIYGRIPPIPEEIRIARGAAAQMRQGLTQSLLTMPGFVLLFIMQGSQARNGFVGTVFILLVAVLIALSIMIIWQFRAAGRFLENTAAIATA